MLYHFVAPSLRTLSLPRSQLTALQPLAPWRAYHPLNIPEYAVEIIVLQYVKILYCIVLYRIIYIILYCI